MVDAIASYHLNPFRCGIAKFNQRLAAELGVRVLACDTTRDCQCPLYSLNLAEFEAGDVTRLMRSLPPVYDVLFW